MKANFWDWPSADACILASNCLPFLATNKAVLSTMALISGGGRITPVTSPDEGAASWRSFARSVGGSTAMAVDIVSFRLRGDGAALLYSFLVRHPAGDRGALGERPPAPSVTAAERETATSSVYALYT